MRKTLIVRFCVILFLALPAFLSAQDCTGLGQNPTTAFPVCGTTSFHQDDVPLCGGREIYVPGCQNGTVYADVNPFWYKFTCFTAGTLGFEITPTDLGDDYDWQLFDITGLDPMEVYTNRNITVSGNWAGTFGKTGAGLRGNRIMECSSNPSDNVNPFSKLITLIEGHNYILLVSHYTPSQSGYSLSFGGGSAVITDPAKPHLQSVKPDCDGVQLRVKLNKKMKCSSVTATGSEFSLSPAGVNIISAQPLNCSGSFDFDSVLLTLSGPLAAGSYQLIINDGTDGTTILDNCAESIPANESMPFDYTVPQPIYADSIGHVGCAPDELLLYFPKRINCVTIAADGSDFQVTGPSMVTVVSATADCSPDQFASVVKISFAAPIYDRGTYTLRLRTGNDGSSIIDECGIEMPLQDLAFNCADTVSAAFNYTLSAGCRENTLSFSHDGAHQVDSWSWLFNATAVTTQSHQMVVPATSTTNVTLEVSNGTCTASTTQVVALDNEVKAAFEMPAVICPEDPLQVENKSTGVVDVWTWNFERIATDHSRDAAPVLFPTTNREAYYTVRLKAENLSLGCADSTRKTVRVLANCFIAVPSGFTPNNDGINDYLYPNNAIKATNLEFRVFNRWGQLVFESREWTAKWDGTINGIPQGSGVYVWFLRYTNRDTGEQVSQKGTTTLIR